jgi:hypothetical protein
LAIVISANTLFHFTKDLDELVSIFEDFFVPRYCLEDYSGIFHGSGMAMRIAFPMTCFCDLPLSQLHEHLDFYGGYGIGMKKEWGMMRGINPVLYMHRESDLSGCISALATELNEKDAGGRKNLRYLMKVLRHIKPYEGEVQKDGKWVLKRFYDEREWRWVPFLTGNDNDEIPSLTEDEYNDPDIRSRADLELARTVRLDFGPGDVKYIVVRSEDEVSKVIKRISSINGIYTKDDIKSMCTRILCSEQIKTDF